MGAKKHIKLALLDKDISVKDLAEMMGKPKQTLYNMMTRDAMLFQTVEEVADAINCDVCLVERTTKKVY